MRKSSLQLYALLVGINDYQLKPLAGCVNDVENVEKFLSDMKGTETVFTKLTNNEATKKAITDTFKALKEKVNSKDTFLFYFSGHGTREKADQLWGETSGMLESIVCYDRNAEKPSDFLLADKELRYLIHQLSETGVHIATLFDCCHSGDNTRNAPLVKAAFSQEDVRERRIGDAFNQRNWEDFIFNDVITNSSVSGISPKEWLPEGSHIQISACEPDESAMEINKSGVFTSTMIKVLTDCGGYISYYALRGRIRQYMRFVYEQQPRVYAVDGKSESWEELLHTNFLNRDASTDKQLAEAVYNKKNGWLLNLGAIHGIDNGSKIELINPYQINQLFAVEVAAVFVDYSILNVNDATLSALGAQEVCKVNVEGLQLKPMKLHLHNQRGTFRQLQQLADELLDHATGVFTWATDEEEADYSLRINYEEAYITKPYDVFRPLVRPVKMATPFATTEIIDQVKHIRKWQFIRELKNCTTESFPENPLQIGLVRVLEDGSEQEIVCINERAEIAFEKNINGWTGTFKVRITNRTPQKLFVALAYVSQDFGVDLNMLPPPVTLLQPGKFVYLGKSDPEQKLKRETPVLYLELSDYFVEYNWPEYSETMKFIVSDKAFDPQAIILEALPTPYTLIDMKYGTNDERAEDRSIRTSLPKPVNFSGWITQTLTLTFVNPCFNQIGHEKQHQMLKWEKMAYYASGLYFKD